jgi:hypothetical protein
MRNLKESILISKYFSIKNLNKETNDVEKIFENYSLARL